MVLLLAIPLLFSIGFLLKQRFVQMDMQEKLENSSLQTITIPIDQLVWVIPDKEIMIDGKLFDIHSMDRAGKSLIFTGLFDKDEDRIKQQLMTILSKQDNDNKTRENSLLLLLFSTFYSNEEVVPLPHYQDKTDRKFLSYSERIPSPPFNSLLRPPRA